MQPAVFHHHSNAPTKTKVRHTAGTVALGLIILCRIVISAFHFFDSYEAYSEHMAPLVEKDPRLLSYLWRVLLQYIACDAFFAVGTIMMVLSLTPLASNLFNRITGVILALGGLGLGYMREDFRLALMSIVCAVPYFVPMESDALLHLSLKKVVETPHSTNTRPSLRSCALIYSIHFTVLHLPLPANRIHSLYGANWGIGPRSGSETSLTFFVVLNPPEMSGTPQSQYQMGAWTVTKLKDELRNRNLSPMGKKSELIARLEEAELPAFPR
ncbi:hypothetical protein PSACC_02082 [Paramicrosporidium saccamoebae]|uniref:SAP domain-containing protein n=1 Tax=Paramicrosporidium saccamoebae TaxID=1246581 RepID=A0A2H9TK14_9FUNG|nr:hypothetical protein PSACC_02082 [Paramicrosporidium saccamoebae]